jgi:heterodisulfide reductase subunit A-like polyferredoxin
VFLAGAGLGPQDIPETVAQASGAAAKVLIFFEAEKAKRRKDTDRGQNTDRQD